MIELGELEAQHVQFARRNARVVAVSVEGLEKAKKSQQSFPHLTLVADERKGLVTSADVVHKGAGPDGEDIAAPTTILIDRHGIVRWLFRPDRSIERLSPGDVLRAVDDYLEREK